MPLQFWQTQPADALALDGPGFWSEIEDWTKPGHFYGLLMEPLSMQKGAIGS
jgi:hypothetical protein